MRPAVAFVLCLIVVIGFALYFTQSNYEMVQVKSSLDGKVYVVRNMPDRQEAADMLANIRIKLAKLVQYLFDKFPTMPCVKRLKEKYYDDPDRMIESTPDSKFTSYSVNKGEKIYFCLRQRSTREELVQENVMMFVSLHELSHIMCESVGHTAEFWHTFAFVLREANNAGVYTQHDFAEDPAEYCGVQISDVPRIPIDEIEQETAIPVA